MRRQAVQADDAVRLRALVALDDVELDFLILFEAFVAFLLDRPIVDEDVWSALAAEEAEALRVVEPLYPSAILRHAGELIPRWPACALAWGASAVLAFDDALPHAP